MFLFAKVCLWKGKQSINFETESWKLLEAEITVQFEATQKKIVLLFAISDWGNAYYNCYDRYYWSY